MGINLEVPALSRASSSTNIHNTHAQDTKTVAWNMRAHNEVLRRERAFRDTNNNDDEISSIAIHDLMNEPTPMGAADQRFHGQLMHVRECLEQATLRTIYGTPY